VLFVFDKIVTVRRALHLPCGGDFTLKTLGKCFILLPGPWPFVQEALSPVVGCAGIVGKAQTERAQQYRSRHACTRKRPSFAADAHGSGSWNGGAGSRTLNGAIRVGTSICWRRPCIYTCIGRKSCRACYTAFGFLDNPRHLSP